MTRSFRHDGGFAILLGGSGELRCTLHPSWKEARAQLERELAGRDPGLRRRMMSSLGAVHQPGSAILLGAARGGVGVAHLLCETATPPHSPASVVLCLKAAVPRAPVLLADIETARAVAAEVQAQASVHLDWQLIRQVDPGQ